MKTGRYTLLLAALLLLTACGGDDEPVVIGGKQDPIAQDKGANQNRNTSGPAAAQQRYEFPHTRGGQSEVIVHECELNSTNHETGINYALEWDHQLHATRWVCYQMYRSVRATNWNRNQWANGDPWAYDPLVPEEEQQATYNELSKTNPPLPRSTYYQKGHILASADRLSSQEANRQTYFMTNIYPQVPDFNEKIWNSMEGRLRTWADQSDTLYVCKGGTIDQQAHILGYTIDEWAGHQGHHIVPRYFYMALLSQKGSQLQALAFWIEHRDGTAWNALRDYVVTIDRLEELTGLDFFCNLPDNTEDTVEATVDYNYWNLK